MSVLSAASRSEAIARQVEFQLGDYRALNAPFAELVNREAWRRSSLFAAYIPKSKTVIPQEKWTELQIDHMPSGGVPWTYPKNGPISKGYRNADLLNSLFLHGLTESAAFDMQDGCSVVDSTLPVFQFNRCTRAENAILWPLAGFHDIGDERFTGSGLKDSLTFDQKEPAVFWRGALVGHSRVGGKRKNIQFVIQEYLAGKISQLVLEEHLFSLPRFRFVSKYFQRPGFNIGFVFPKRLSYFLEVKIISALTKEFVRREDQLSHRYLLQISGNDWATSFPWHSETNSLVIRENYIWEAFYDCHFLPWQHYLPVGSGFSGLSDIIDWASANAETCKRMARNANISATFLSDGEARSEALSRVCERYNRFYVE